MVPAELTCSVFGKECGLKALLFGDAELLGSIGRVQQHLGYLQLKYALWHRCIYECGVHAVKFKEDVFFRKALLVVWMRGQR